MKMKQPIEKTLPTGATSSTSDKTSNRSQRVLAQCSENSVAQINRNPILRYNRNPSNVTSNQKLSSDNSRRTFACPKVLSREKMSYVNIENSNITSGGIHNDTKQSTNPDDKARIDERNVKEDDADDEDEGDNTETKNEKKKKKKVKCRELKSDTNESEAASSLLVDQLSKLHINKKSEKLDEITKAFCLLGISSDDKADEAVKSDIVSKGPFPKSRVENKPYSVTPKKKETENDIQNIKLSDAEIEFFKNITNEEWERIMGGIQLDNFCSPAKLDQQFSFADSATSAQCSPASVTAPSPLMDHHGYGGSPYTKLTVEEDLCSNTSDYFGSPAGSSNFSASPNPSVSPEHSNDVESVFSLNSPVSDSTLTYANIRENSILLQDLLYKENQPISNDWSSSPDVHSVVKEIPSVNLQTPLNSSPRKITQPHLQNIGYVYETPSTTLNSNIIRIEAKPTAVFPVTINRCANIMPLNVVGQPVTPVLPVSRMTSLSSGNTVKDMMVSPTNGKRYRSIAKVEGKQVFETNMQRSGYDRLMDTCKCMKKKSFLIQWVTTLVETERIDEEEKSLILLNLLKQFSNLFSENKSSSEESVQLEQLWEEKLVARIECINQLLKKPEYFSKPDKEGNTPLKYSALYNYRKPVIARCIADCIVRAGDNPDQIDSDGSCVLHHLCQRGDSHVEVLAELLNVKTKDGRPAFDVNRKNREDKTPLHLAVHLGCLSVVKVLTFHHARVDIKDCTNSTPLHVALNGDYDIQILRTLLGLSTCRQAFSIEDHELNTPLVKAIKNTFVSKRKQLSAIEFLLISGASPKLRSTARPMLDYIDDDRREEIKTMLLLQGKKKCF